MDLVERLIFFSLGSAFGYMLALIVGRLKSIEGKLDSVQHEVHEVDEIVKNHKEEEGAINWSWNSVALMVVVLLVAYAAVMSQLTSNSLEDNFEEDKISRCQSGVENRNVQRELVEAVYKLATGSIQRDPDMPALKPEELKQYNAYIDRVNEFRKDMYNKIKPSEDCAPFVKDDNVDPPSDPYPQIETPKETPK